MKVNVFERALRWKWRRLIRSSATGSYRLSLEMFFAPLLFFVASGLFLTSPEMFLTPSFVMEVFVRHGKSIATVFGMLDGRKLRWGEFDCSFARRKAALCGGLPRFVV